MDGSRYCHTNCSQTEKVKYLISLICEILKKGTVEYIYKTEIRITDVKNLWLAGLKVR